MSRICLIKSSVVNNSLQLTSFSSVAFLLLSKFNGCDQLEDTLPMSEFNKMTPDRFQGRRCSRPPRFTVVEQGKYSLLELNLVKGVKELQFPSKQLGILLQNIHFA